MTAEPLLKLAAKMFARHRLDAVLIGNAAAALQGAPVTTVDLDFLRRTVKERDALYGAARRRRA